VGAGGLGQKKKKESSGGKSIPFCPKVFNNLNPFNND